MRFQGDGAGRPVTRAAHGGLTAQTTQGAFKMLGTFLTAVAGNVNSVVTELAALLSGLL